MIIENPAALQFFITDDIYMLKQDVNNLNNLANTVPVITQAEPVAIEPLTVIEPEPKVLETPQVVFKYLGENQQSFLIVFHSNGAGKFDDKHFEALKNTLQRKQLTLDDVAIIDAYQYPGVTIADLYTYFKPTRLLLLGSQCLLPGWDNLALNVLTKTGTCTALYTYAFADMMSDKDKVRAFWEQMKAL